MTITREYIPALFDEFQKLFDARSLLGEAPLLTRGEMSGLSLYEDEDHLYLEAAVPGLKSDQIQISVEKGVVWIKGEKENDEKNSKGKIHFQTRRIYSYRVPLPVRIDETSTPEAVCKDGILSVTFEKSRCCKPMKISIKAS